MDTVKMELPVFLPGNHRDWTEFEGIATITEIGEIHIRLRDPEASKTLVEMAREGTLYQVSFDYRMSVETIDNINKRNQKSEVN